MDHGSRVWSTSAWQAGAIAWADDVLAGHRTVRTGGPERVRVRPWSVTLALPTDRGRVWVKAVAPFAAHAPALLDALAQVLPGRFRAPLAVDAARGWTLTRDEGETVAADPVDVDVWCAIARDMAVLSRASADHETRLLGTGLPDLRPALLVGVADDLLHTLAGLPDDHRSHLAPASARTIGAALPALGVATRALRDGPVPATLRHGDLHPGNVVGRRPFRLLDLDDAHWAHPFEDLVAPRRLVGDAFGTAAAAAVTDAYLSVWDDVATVDELRRLADLAAHVQAVSRAYTWWRATSSMEPAEVARYGGHAGAWLERLAGPAPPRGRT